MEFRPLPPPPPPLPPPCRRLKEGLEAQGCHRPAPLRTALLPWSLPRPRPNNRQPWPHCWPRSRRKTHAWPLWSSRSGRQRREHHHHHRLPCQQPPRRRPRALGPGVGVGVGVGLAKPRRHHCHRNPTSYLRRCKPPRVPNASGTPPPPLLDGLPSLLVAHPRGCRRNHKSCRRR